MLEETSATLMKEKRKIDTNKMFSRNNKQRFGWKEEIEP